MISSNMKFFIFCTLLGAALAQRGHYAGNSKPILGARYQTESPGVQSTVEQGLGRQAFEIVAPVEADLPAVKPAVVQTMPAEYPVNPVAPVLPVVPVAPVVPVKTHSEAPVQGKLPITNKKGKVPNPYKQFGFDHHSSKDFDGDFSHEDHHHAHDHHHGFSHADYPNGFGFIH